MGDIITKATRYNSSYRKDLALSRKTPQGVAIEIGIVDINVNPEYISKCILVEIEKNTEGNVKGGVG